MKLLKEFYLFFLVIPLIANIQNAISASSKDSISMRAASKPNSAFRLQAFKSLVAKGRYDIAYGLARDMLPYWEGDKRFDFSYGLAAVETLNYDEALFAFERLLFETPDEPRYRLELARTHFFLRNLDRAEIEFNQVLEIEPPYQVKTNVERFLDQISILRRSVEPAFMIGLDLGAGYDSNINSATSNTTLPKEELIFPVDINLNDESRETNSAYWSTLASLYSITPLTKLSAIDLRLLANKRENLKTTTYNLDTIMLESGLSYTLAKIKSRLGARYQYVLLDSQQLLNSYAGLIQLQWKMIANYRAGLNVTYGNTAYFDNPFSDINQSQITTFIASPTLQNGWQFNLTYGDDTALEPEGEHKGKTYFDIGIRANHLIGQRGNINWGITSRNSKYKAVNRALFTKLREDETMSASFGWRYSFTSRLTLRNDYSYSNTKSTLQANTYQRSKAELGLSYQL